jgi:hypothetical protein
MNCIENPLIDFFLKKIMNCIENHRFLIPFSNNCPILEKTGWGFFNFKVKLKKYKTNSLKIGSDLWLKNLGLNTINLARVEKHASPGYLQDGWCVDRKCFFC